MNGTRRRLAPPLIAMGIVAALALPTGPGPLGESHGSTATALAATRTKVRVRMWDDYFKPRTRTVARGTRVVWVNRGERPHTTTSRKGLWHKVLAPGERWGRTFKKRGTFRYYCTFHTGMVGKIVVG